MKNMDFRDLPQKKEGGDIRKMRVSNTRGPKMSKLDLVIMGLGGEKKD